MKIQQCAQTIKYQQTHFKYVGLRLLYLYAGTNKNKPKCILIETTTTYDTTMNR